MALPTLISFVAGEDAIADDVNTNFDRILGALGGLRDENISPLAAIKGYKLSSALGDQVPENRLAQNACSARVLQSDVATGAPSAAVATAAHIKDGIITSSKLASGCGKLLIYTQAVTTTTITATAAAGIYASSDLKTQTSYPKSAWDLVAVYPKDLSTGTGTGYSLALQVDETGSYANIRVNALGTNGSITSLTLVWVFQSKV